ncbi:MAG: DUF1428 domain-containing protein [Candidatus Woesearchaeota archaeon]|nr:DUF1428 domain-containing protein [Candidatus Woesearchaeota archaeon]
MTYVDGFVLPVPTKNKAKYRKVAREAGKMWKKHGALQYIECWGDEMHPAAGGMKMAKFPKIAQAKRSEAVVFAFIIYKNKTHRNKVNKAVMKECAEQQHDDVMPFDVKRMAWGGFTAIVEE